MNVRLITACLALAAVVAGPLQPLAFAQQPAAPPPPPPPVVVQPVPPPPPPPPAVATETTTTVRRDIYDVAAGAVTVAKAPFNVALCAMGAGVGAALFVLTLGSGYKASARVVEEGCKGPWLIRGDDLRPDAPRTDERVGETQY